MCRMAYAVTFIIINFLLLHNGFCEINVEEKHRLFNGFIDNLNNLPNQIFIYEDGIIKDAQKVDENHYKITAYLKATELSNLDSTKHLHCKATICDLKQNGIVIENNTLECEDYQSKSETAGEGGQDGSSPQQSVTADTNEPTLTQDSVKLNNNEVVYNPVGTSDDVPIPRPKPSMPCIGCSSQVDPQAQGVEELAALGIKHLDKHESEIKHKLDSVVEVTRQVQVVNGIRYILTLIVDKCKSELNECNEKVACKISILEKPWLKLPTGSKYRAILANNCTEQWQYGDDGEVITDAKDDKTSDKDSQSNEEVKVIHNTELQALPHSEKSLTDEQIKDVEEQIIPHSEFQQTSITNDFQNYGDPSVDYKQQVTQDETAKYFSENATPFKNSAKEDNSATTLTDDKKKAIEELTNLFNFAGFNNNAFAQRPEYIRVRRSFNKDLQVMTMAEKFNNRYMKEMKPGIPSIIDGTKSRNKRQLVGGQQEKNPSDPQYHALAEESVQKYMLSSGNTQHHKVVNVDKVTVQVVSGIITRIDFKIIPTNCQLNSNGQPSSENCEPESDADTISCHSEVWEQPWLNKKEITVINCNIDESKTRVKRHLYGGLQEQNPSDPQYHALAEESLQKYLLSTGNTQPHKVVKVDKVTVQVVSGSLTRIDFKIIPTSCPSPANCEANVDADTISCHSEIWEQPWLKKKEITVNCNIDESKSRRKRGIPGGLQEKNPSDPQYHALAEESLQKYLLSSGNTQPHKVVKVDKVTVQVVSGSLTRIDFKIIPTSCPSSANCEAKVDADTISCHSEIWEQPWLKKKEITVNCNIDESKSRRKRGIPGGLQEKNPSDPQYHALAEESLQNYLLSSGNTQLHKVVKVDKVTVQVVSGSLTRIDFKIIPISCPSSANCEAKVDADTISCHSEVWEQPWLKKKEITVNCNIDESKSRRKRGIPGSLQEKNPSDPQYHALAEESLQKYLLSSGNTQPHKVVKVDKVTVQVVSGSLTRIDFKIIPISCPSSANCEAKVDADTISCHSEVWEQPWLKKKEITVNCNIDESKSRKKRGIPGGLQEKNPSDPQYHALAEESLQKYLLSSGNTQPHKVVKVDKVTVQVVSGSLTRIDFKIIPISCPSSANCEAKVDADTISCHSEVWEQPWLKKKEITVNCNIDESKSRRKRGIPGGLQEKNPSDPQYHALAGESLQKYLLSSGNTQPHKVVKVDKVTVQVVSGSLTRIDFKIIPISCLSSANCEAKVDADTISCHSEIWEQPWLKKKEITVNCNIDESKSRRKRGIPGGLQEKNPSDPQYHALAEESLQKYLLSSGNTQPHKVVKVDKVTVQVVSGSLTRIDFKIIPTSCPSSANCEAKVDADTISCHSEIWEQPWLKKKEITVNCNIDESKSRRKRGIPGGLQEKNPSDPQYHALAEESLQNYLLSSGNTQLHKVVKVDKVTVQVVSGSLTRIDFKIIPISCPSSANCEAKVDADTISCHSEVWEQPWLKKKEITVNCNIDESKSRRKRGIPGSLQEKNPSDPQYHALAEESLQKYLLSSGNTQPHKVVKVDKVTVQVVSGSLTRIDFKIIPISCPSSANCEAKVDADTISCHSEVWEQPWLKKKEITVNCNIDESKSRKKRGIPGGLQEENPSDPQYHALAEESLQKYLLSSGNTQPHKVVKVDKVTVQVVSGSLTRIDFKIIPISCPSSANCEAKVDADTISCHSEVWEQPWLKKKEITVNCNIDESKSRRKRGIPGGLQEKNPSDPQYHALAGESLQKYLLSSGNTQPHKVVKVDKVTVQVVSGSLTRIDFKIIPISCLSSANCEAKVDADTISCHSEIWEQPWLKKKEITVNCNIDESKSRRKRGIPGGLQEKNTSDPQYHALAEESLQKYLLSSGNTQSHKVVKVDKVTVQVVSGSLTRIDFKIIPTSCPSSANCEAKVDADTISCHSEIWEQPWLNKKEITVNCNTDESKTRIKRGLAGGHEEKNPEEPKYHILAEESLQKYLLLSSSTQNHKVIKVEKVTVQVVAGSLTRIDFSIIPTNCYLNSSGQPTSSNCDEQSNAAAISCHSEIWEQPWLNKKEITVNCDNDDTSSNNFKRKKRALVGGPQNKDVTKPMYKQLAEQSLRKFEHKHKSKHHYMVVDIKHVVEQVVSGFIYKIDYTATPTNCSTQISDVSKCHPLDSKVVFNCHTEIVDHVGRSKKKIAVQCHKDLLSKDFTDEENTDDNNSHIGSFHRKSFTKGDHIFNRLKRQVDEAIDDDSAKIALHLANKAIAHIEAKYPTYRKQKLVKIFSIDKHNIAGIRYKIKIEVGFTDCWALSTKENCTLLKDYVIPNRFCRVNVWLRPWTENPPAYHVTCDHEENLTGELYHIIQAQILFYNFVKQFSPSYAEDSTEMAKRFLIFKENIKKIHDLNIHERGTATYGITRFADLTYEEFASFFTGLKPNLRHANNVPMRKAHIPNIKLPQKFDWRDFNAVTEIKNQGSCGSCWAFSVTGNIEGQWKIHSGQLVSLSEQELVDCDNLDQGCNGGLPDNAYRAIEQLGGLETETEYPYQGDGEKCIFNKTLAKVQITGAVNISSNETDMAKWLVKKGPISIGINANAMQFYVGGVSHPWKMLCNPNNLDHGVLIVGYGIKEYPLFNKSLPYWIVKNSWGATWGEQGYYRVYRGDGTCGLNLMASSAVIDHSQ